MLTPRLPRPPVAGRYQGSSRPATPPAPLEGCCPSRRAGAITSSRLASVTAHLKERFLSLRMLELFRSKHTYATAHWGPDAPLQDHPRYKQVKVIARGSYGLVLLALDTYTGQHVALKFIERGPQITKYVEREILNHQRLRHPHIIRLKEVFLTDDYLVLVMEYAAGGDLFKLVAGQQGLSEDDARWFFQQFILAIDYCHKMGVANRDIKLENTLLDGSPRPLVKLADFGFSKDENCQSAPGSRVGTPAYLAPEVISNIPGQSYDAKKADVWSCGVLLYAMVTGTYPFVRMEDATAPPARQLHNVVQRILNVQYSFPLKRQLSAACMDLISKMLVADPKQRLSVQEVLLHPWCSTGLQPEMLTFNNSLVAGAQAELPTPKMLQDVRAIVVEAQQQRHAAQAQQQQAQQQQAASQKKQADPGAEQPDPWHDQSGGALEDSWLDDMIDTDPTGFDFRPACDQSRSPNR